MLEAKLRSRTKEMLASFLKLFTIREKLDDTHEMYATYFMSLTHCSEVLCSAIWTTAIVHSNGWKFYCCALVVTFILQNICKMMPPSRVVFHKICAKKEVADFW